MEEENRKAAIPRPKLTEMLNRAVQIDTCQPSPPSPRPMELSFSKQPIKAEDSYSAGPEDVSRPSSELRSPVPSSSRPDRPSSSSSKRATKLQTEHRSPKKSYTVPDKSTSKMSPCQSEVSVSAPSVVKSQESFKLPKIVNSPLISAPEPDPIAPDTSTHSHVTAEESALSLKPACSRCGSKKPRSESSPHRKREEPPYPSPGYAYSSLPSHNLHLSSPPVIIQQAPLPYPYPPPPSCHECSAHHSHSLRHSCHSCPQRHCSPCCPPREEPRFSQEFECLKDFIRDEIRSGWSKSPRSRRPKSYSSSRGYPSGTSTPSETESEDPYLVAGLSSSKGARGAKFYKPRLPYSGHSLAATHSLATNSSDASSVLEDELFLKLVSNPAKYSHELQEIAKLLTSPPVSRASSTTSRQKLRTIKHLVREAITSYSASELESSDAETPRTPDESSEESEQIPSRLDHVSSRTLHKARRAKERCEGYISPKPSILKTASRPSEQAMETAASLTGIKRVNFSKETVNIDDGQTVEIGSIPDDFVVVEEDEISLATQEMQASMNLEEVRPSLPPTELVAYPYDLYMAGDRTEACTIVQSMTRSEEGAGRAEAAGRVLSELRNDSVGVAISISHSLELKASLPSIPSYLSEVESVSALSQRPNRPALESEASRSRMNPGSGSSSRQGGLLSHSSASLNQIIPRAQGDDELEQEKRSSRSRQSDSPEPRRSEPDPTDANENQIEENCPPVVPPKPQSRRNSLTLREHESRRHSLTQMSKISLVSRPSVQHSHQPLLEEETPPITPQTQAKIEKQASRSSLVEKASKILSSISSLVSLKSNSGTKVAPQEIAKIGESESNSSLRPDPDKIGMKSSASRSQSRQEDIPSRSQSRQEDIPSRSQSRQEDIPSRSQSRQDVPSRSQSRQDIPSRSQSRQEDIPIRSQSRQEDIPSRSQSRQEDILSRSQSRQDVPSRSQSRQDVPSRSQSRQDVPSRSQSRQEDIPSRSQSRQEDIPSRSQSRQEDIPSRSQSRQEDILSRSQSRQDVPSRSQSRQEDTPSRSQSRQEDIPSRSQSRQDVPSRSQSRQEDIPIRSQSRQEDIPSRSQSRQEDILSRSQSRQDVPSRSQSRQDVPSRSQSRQEDIPSRSQSRQEDIPSRSQSRQEDILSRSQSRQEDIPSRSQSRQEDIPSRSQSRQEDIPSRSQSRQEDIPSRSQSRQEDILSRSQSRQEDIPSRSQSRQEDIPSRSQSRQEDIPNRSQSRQEDIPSRSQSRQEDILSRSQSRQEDIPSRSQSRQEDIPSRSQSRQEDIPSRSQSRQEDIISRSQSRQDIPSRSQSRQEDIISRSQSRQDIPSRSQSRQDEVERTENDAKEDETPQEKVSNFDVTNVCIEDASHGCDCSNCPEPVQCTDDCICANPNQELETDNPVSQQQPGIEPTLSKSSLKLLSSQPELSASSEKSGNVSPSVSAPVKILLSPEVEAIKTEEKSETEMGVKMTFSKEWKITCTKDCPDGVKETTITDWRDPNWEESEFYPREKELTSETERAPTSEGEELTNTSRSLANLQNSDEQSEPNLQNSDEQSKPNLQNSVEQSKPNLQNSDEQSKPNLQNSDEQSEANLQNSDEQNEPNLQNSDEQSQPNQVDLENKVDPVDPPTGENALEKSELSEVEKIDAEVDDVLTPEGENEIIAAIQSALQADQLETDPTSVSVASPSRDGGVDGETVYSKVETENVPQEEGNSTVEKAMQLDEQLTQSIEANESSQSDSPVLEKGEDQDEMTDPEGKGNSKSELEVVETDTAADIEPQAETDQPTDDTQTQTVETHVDSPQDVELSPLEGESLEQESGGNNPDANVPSPPPSNESCHA